MRKCDFNKVANNFIEITLPHRCSPENLLYIFRTPFAKNTFGRLLLNVGDLVSAEEFSGPFSRTRSFVKSK